MGKSKKKERKVDNVEELCKVDDQLGSPAEVAALPFASESKPAATAAAEVAENVEIAPQDTAQVEPKSKEFSEAQETIYGLRNKIAALLLEKAVRKVASGSKPRPNLVYTLLDRPPKWSDTPQVAQLQQILFDQDFMARHLQPDGSVKVPEPELFAQVVAGHGAGILRTKQPPVRIFQYYRSTLLNAGSLRWA